MDRIYTNLELTKKTLSEGKVVGVMTISDACR